MTIAPTKAIQTFYNGYHFRSRIEARWAVFFDTLGVEYEYEKEGYDLGEHGRYLPDFWLPHLTMWFEVKGDLISEVRTYGWGSYCVYPELERARALADATGFPACVAAGAVGVYDLHFFAWDLTDSSGGNYDSDHARWCVSNGMATLDLQDGRSDRIFLTDNLMGEQMPQFTFARDFGADFSLVEHAYRCARSARFEHGQKGASWKN